MSDSEMNLEFVGKLGEEFVERFRRGERPSIEEYTLKYPDYADEIADVFPTLMMMEDLAPEDSDSLDGPDQDSSPALGNLKVQRLGDYRIIREVGRGGMGIVYEAEQVSLGRHVALKVLPKELLATAKHRSRFEREAKAAAKLHHTNIVPVFGVGQEADMGYYVMQFIQGLALDEVVDELKRMNVRPDSGSGSLHTGELRVSRRDLSAADVARSLMTGEFQPPAEEPPEPADAQERGDKTLTHHAAVNAPAVSPPPASSPPPSGGRLSDTFSLSDSSVVLPGAAESGSSKSAAGKRTYWESVAHIGVQVAEALEYAHGQGVLHRDIKPSNLLLDMQGVAWVTDFGLAKLDDERGLTETGDVLGTLRYMAPETFKGNSDARSELYSLGLTLYELLALRPAFGETNRQTLIDEVLNADIEPLAKVNSDIPRDLVTIVHKAIEREPAHRYQTGQELADDLQRFIDDEPIKARRISAIERMSRWSRRNRGLAASLAAVCALLLVINIAGPILTLQMLDLNRDLQDKQDQLNETITQLESTGQQLQEESKAATKLAAEKGQLAVNEAAARAEAQRLQAEAERQRAEAERQKAFARRSQYTASLLAARHAITTSGGYSSAKELLAELRPQAGETDMRGWEWYYLDAQPSPGGFVVNDFSDSQIAVTFSPDGKLLAAGGYKTIRLLNAKSGRLEQTLSGHQDWIWALAWSPDGSRLASGSQDKTARIWNPQTGKEELQLLGHTDRVADVAWSPDGKRLVTVGTADKVVKTWDAASGKNLLTLKEHTDAVWGVDWSSDGRRLVSCSSDETVRIWDADTGEAIHVMTGHTAAIERVQFSPDGRRIASAAHATTEKPVIIWDAEQGIEVMALKGLANPFAVGWSPDGSKLAATGWQSGNVVVWDADSGQKLNSFTGHQRNVCECSWSPDGHRLASASWDKTVRVWAVVKEKPAPEFEGHKQPVRTLAWSRDGSRIASASFDKTVKIWDVATKQNLLTFDRHKKYVYCVDWNADGTRLASCGQEQVFHVWEAETGRVLHTIKAADSGEINVVAWSPDGAQIASAADDKTVRVFDAETGEQVKLFHLKDMADAVDWSSDGRQLAASSASGEVKAWNFATGDQIAHFSKTGQQLWAVRFSPDGTKLAVGGKVASQDSVFGDTGGGADGTLTVWDLEANQELHQLRGHINTVRSLEWSGDGARLLSAGHDGKIILWDAVAGNQLLVIDDPDEQGVLSARFSPDELTIASAGAAPGIRLWDAAGGYAAELSPKLLTSLDERITSRPTGDALILRGRIRAAQGEWDNAAADFERAAALRPPDDKTPGWIETSWWVAGPYPMSLEHQQPPETQLDPHQPIPSADGSALPPRHWTKVNLTSRQGLNLGRILAGAEQISAYAMTRVFASSEQSAGLLLGADDQARVWLNGSRIYSQEGMSRAVPDDNVVEMTLKPGWNTLLFKVSNNTGGHGLFARLSQDPLDLARAFDRNEQWEKAFTYWDRARAANSDDSSLLFSCGRAALKTGRRQLAGEVFAQALDLLVEKTASYRTMAGLYYEDAQSLLEAGDSDQAAVSLDKSRQLYQQVLQSASATGQDAAGLADVLLAMSQTEWAVLEPTEMTSAGGATLERQKDGSIFVSGENPDEDLYTVALPLNSANVCALRLETLTDKRLPAGGSGRNPAGKFDLAELSLSLRSVHDPAVEVPISIARARADVVGNSGREISRALDGSRWTHWSAVPYHRLNHVAVFEFQLPTAVGRDHLHLVVRLDTGTAHAKHNLGRFRLSVTDDPSTFDTENQRIAIARIKDPWARLGAACAAVGDSAQAATWFAKALQQASGFAARGKITQQISDLQIDLNSLVAQRPDDPLLLEALAGRQLEAGQTEEAAESLARARRLTEALLAESPDDEALAGFLADLLLADTTRWTVLKPSEMTSKGGATLTMLEDNSVLAGGPIAKRELYTITAATDVQRITAIRLEALKDDSLPNQGPGRSNSGGFVMDRMDTHYAPVTDLSDVKRVVFSDATADYSPRQERIIVKTARWHHAGGGGSEHEALYRLANEIATESGARFTFQMTFDHGPKWPDLKLGRFRLSVTDDPAAFDTNGRRLSIARMGNPWARLGAAYAAVGDNARAAQWFVRALKGTPDFAAKRELAERIDELQLDVSDLRALHRDDPLLLSVLAKRQAEAGQTDEATESYAKARALTEALLAESRDDEALAGFLADLLLADTTRWTVLEPVEMKSKGGTTLSMLADGSIRASGVNPNSESYTIVSEIEVAAITALRLELLPDDSFPNGGSGRSNNGSFTLTELSGSLLAPGDTAGSESLLITRAAATFENVPVAPITGAIDGSTDSYWNTFPRMSNYDFAVFEIAAASIPSASRLSLNLDFGSRFPHANLGRFRLSVTDDPDAFERHDRRFEIQRPESPWERLGIAYAAVGDPSKAAEWYARVLVRAPDFAARRNIVERIDKLQLDLDRFVAEHPDDPLLLAALARRQADAGQTDEAAESFARARTLMRARLMESPTDKALADFLADLLAKSPADEALDKFLTDLLSDTQISWIYPKPVEMTSAGGATFEPQPDGSVFVTGTNPKEDLYTVVLPLTSTNVSALRLETLADERLKDGGSGRSGSNGNFHLAEVSLSLRSAGDPSIEKQIPIKRAGADVPGNHGHVIEHTIDGNRKTFWYTFPLHTLDHEAVFEFQLPADGTLQHPRLVVRLDTGISQWQWPQHNLGRFRLSLTDEPAAFENFYRRLAVARIKIPWERIVAAYAAAGDSTRPVKWFARVLEQTPEFADRRDLVERINQTQTDVNGLLALRPDDPLLHWALAKHQLAAGMSEAAAKSFTKARSLTEALLSKSPDDKDLDGFLADLLLDETERAISWTILEPGEMTSVGGATLKRLDDNSILSGGPNVGGDVYNIRTRIETPGVRAIRLEALPDPSLPNRGPGTHSSGNFQLAAFRVFAASEEGVELSHPLKITDARASYHYDVGGTDLRGGKRIWHVWGRFGERHTAVYKLATPLQPGQPLMVQLRHRDAYGGINLGRFRLSVTDNPDAFNSFAAATIEDPWVRRGAAYAALGDAVRAAQWYSQALERSPDFAARRNIVERIDKLQLDLDRFVAENPDDPLLLAALARRQADAGQTDEATESFARARTLTRARLMESPTDHALADFFADLLAKSPADEALDKFLTDLLSDTQISWSFPEPVEMTSAGGAKFELQPDGSLFVFGTNPEQDLYTVVLPLTSTNVSALRLETLADERLKDGGSGRSDINGNFHLGQVSLSLRSAGDPSFEKQIPIKRACADVAGSQGRVIEHTIDGNRKTLWSPYPLQMLDHEAVFEFQLPADVTLQDPRLVVQLDTGLSGREQHGLGRFRLSLTDEPAAFENFERRLAVARIEIPWERIGAAYAAAGDATRAIKWFARVLEQTPEFADRRDLVERINQTQTDVNGLLALRPNDPLLHWAQAKRQVAAGTFEEAAKSFTKARSLSEALLAESPDDETLAGFLVDLLLDETERSIHWTILEPVEMKSEGGATLTKLADDSILASGKNPDHDVYTITTATDLSQIRAVRLEALTDVRLPKQGPGRHSAGFFIMSKFQLTAQTASGAASPLKFDAACADYSLPNAEIQPQGRWHTAGGGGRPHVAFFRAADEVTLESDSLLKFQLAFNVGANWPERNLGRFRLSVTNDLAGFDTNDRRLAIAKMEDPWVRLAAAYAAVGETEQAVGRFAKLMDEAPDTGARSHIAEQAMQDEAVVAALVELRPDDVALLIAHGKALASHGDWDAASAALARAARLDAGALPKWVQTGFWKVGPYPQKLEAAYPPESNPDPLQPVASVAMKGKDLPAQLHWRPAKAGPNGRIELGTEVGCNFVLTRVWSAAEQEVALQLGDDDALRAWVNGDLLLQTKPNRGAARPGEHAVAATLQPGWNTVLLKVRNDSQKSNAILTLAGDPQDLTAARLGARIYQADQLVAGGKADEALALLGELLDEHTSDAALFAKRAGAYEQLGRWEEAVADWTRALELKPDEMSSLYRRAAGYNWHLGQHEKALADCNRLVELQPDGSGPLLNRSLTYNALGQADEAIADVNRAVQLGEPGHLWRAYQIRGGYLAQRGQWKKAADDYAKAFDMEVRDWARFEGYRSHALLQLMTGDTKGHQAGIAKLAEHLETGMTADQARWLVYATIAGPETLSQEHHDRLLKIVDAKLTQDLPAWKPHLTAAIEYRAGKLQQAAELFDQNPNGPNDAAFHFLAALVHHKSGDHEQAQKLFDETSAWLKQQEDTQEGPAAPSGIGWPEWTIIKSLQREAAALLGDKAKPQPVENAATSEPSTKDNATSAKSADDEQDN